MANIKPIMPKYLNRILVVCSECEEKIYAPSGRCKYKYCYNCGAKFDRPITAGYINEVKSTGNYELLKKENE